MHTTITIICAHIHLLCTTYPYQAAAMNLSSSSTELAKYAIAAHNSIAIQERAVSVATVCVSGSFLLDALLTCFS
jgi:hypothetical protein